MDPEKFYKAQCETALQMGKVTATEYRHGAVVNGWPSRWPLSGNPHKGKRGIITSMSPRSMIRAAFQIGNSPADFDLMTTLTFRAAHINPKECLRKWCLAMKLNALLTAQWGWVMEYQSRGVVHYHVLHRQDELLVNNMAVTQEWETVTRKGQQRTVLKGSAGHYMQDAWMRIVGDNTSEFFRFQRGGITERMTNPELTAKYMGGYLGKLAQKQLPDSEVPQGRWWWLSEAARPVPGRTVTLAEWKLDRPHHLVHDKRKICSSWDVSDVPRFDDLDNYPKMGGAFSARPRQEGEGDE